MHQQLDALLEQEYQLWHICHQELPEVVNLPPINWSIDELMDELAKQWTRFTKNQLHLLKLHWWIPDITDNRYRFTGEEVLIICLARISSGSFWIHFVLRNFGGDCRRCSFNFRRFTNYLYINFYHKISGRLIEKWLPHIFGFLEFKDMHMPTRVWSSRSWRWCWSS
jgi:hypothetical protein